MGICSVIQIYSNLKHVIDTVPFFFAKADNLFFRNLNHTAELQYAPVVKWDTDIELVTISKEIIPSVHINSILSITYNLKQRSKAVVHMIISTV
jgi:hypothetical protein